MINNSTIGVQKVFIEPQDINLNFFANGKKYMIILSLTQPMLKIKEKLKKSSSQSYEVKLEDEIKYLEIVELK